VKKKTFGYMLAASILCIGIMIPGTGSADPQKYQCSQYQQKGVCVKAALVDLDIDCWTNESRRPQCKATAKAGSVAKYPGPGNGPAYTLWEVRASASRFFATTGIGDLWIPRHEYSYGDAKEVPMDGSEVTNVRKVSTPELTGPRYGCIKFRATFRVDAEALDTDPYNVPDEDAQYANAEHTHSIGPETYCVFQVP
jgi:hypothetical protein